MRGTPVIVGIAAGAVLGLGGVVAADVATKDAEAQSGGQELSQNIQAEITSANLRSQRGIKQATTVWNQLGIHLAQAGTQITAKGPRVSQRKAVGGGLPITVLDQETQNKINARGSQGPQGPQGPPGPPGPSGSAPNIVAFDLTLDAASGGNETPIATSGPLSLNAFCDDPGAPGGPITAGIVGDTTLNDQVIMVGEDTYDGFGASPFLTPGLLLTERVFILGPASVTGTNVFNGAVNTPDVGFISDASGNYISMDTDTVRIGTFYNGNDCVFSGFFSVQPNP